MFDVRLLGCQGDGNAGVVAVSVYMGVTRGFFFESVMRVNDDSTTLLPRHQEL